MMTETTNIDLAIIPENPKKIVYFAVGPQTQQITCPFCEKSGETIISEKIDSWENINSYLSCLLCWCPLSAISLFAYLIPCFKICQHYCSKCGEYLGTYRRPKL